MSVQQTAVNALGRVTESLATLKSDQTTLQSRLASDVAAVKSRLASATSAQTQIATENLAKISSLDKEFDAYDAAIKAANASLTSGASQIPTGPITTKTAASHYYVWGSSKCSTGDVRLYT